MIRSISGGTASDCRVSILGEPNFSYIQEIAEPLTKFLTHAAGLRRDLLARHIANIDFWVAEVKHCLWVLDDYPARVRRMRDAAQPQLNYHWDEDEGYATSARPTKTLNDTERATVRRELCDSARKFLNRSYREGLLDIDRLEAFFDGLGMQAPGKD